MTELLCKSFVKIKDGEAPATTRSRYGVFATIIGVFVNIVLFIGKFIVGFLFHSSSITADAFNNLSDAGSSIVSLISFKISMKPADRDHPFGHARIEYIASMIVSFLILTISVELFKDSISKIINPTIIEFDLLTFIVLTVAVLLKLWLYFFYSKVANKIDSTVLRASAADSLGDILSTSAVLVSSIVVYFTKWYILDSIVGLGVAVLIFIAGIKIFIETMHQLLGEAPSGDDVDAICKLVNSFDGVYGIHDMMIHNYGPGHNVVSLHVEVDGSQNIFDSHDIIDNIERTVQQKLGMECTIHMDPIVTNDERINELRGKVLELARTIDHSLNIHDFRFVEGKTHTNLIFDISCPFEVKMSNDEIAQKMKELVSELNPNYYCVITIDRL